MLLHLQYHNNLGMFCVDFQTRSRHHPLLEICLGMCSGCNINMDIFQILLQHEMNVLIRVKKFLGKSKNFFINW